MNNIKLNSAIDNAKRHVIFEVGTITDNENREVFEHMLSTKIIKRVAKVRKNKKGFQFQCYKYIGNK
jgi:hypothetical protein